MTALDEWAERIGKDNAEDIKNQAAARGSRMHKHIEDYITEGKEVVEDANEIHTSMALLVLEKKKNYYIFVPEIKSFNF